MTRGAKGKGGGLPPLSPAATPNPLTLEKAAENVTHGHLHTEIERFRAELSVSLTNSITKSVLASVNTSIDNLQSALEAKIVILQDTVDSIRHEFEVYKTLSEDVITAVKKRIQQLETTTVCQLIYDNEKEQRHRSRSFRLHGKKSSAKDAKSSMRELYSFIIVPSLQRAVDLGELDEVPSLCNVAEYGHNLKPRKVGDIPSTIFKFTSRYFFQTFMAHARDVIKEINERDGVNYRISYDLTYWNRRCMSALFSEPLVGKVRLSGTNIQFQLKSDADSKWHVVKNPTGSTLVEMETELEFPEIEIEP